MTKKEIEREIRRLAPWYYLWDVGGVRTDITTTFGHWAHASIEIPPSYAPYLKGKTILDVACNEGAYGHAARKCGAGSVLGFDCRADNIEKARFVTRILEIEDVEFQIGSADTWPDDQKYDVVFLCGLIYHLPKPWETIRKYCAIARESILVTTWYRGGKKREGYTPWKEGDSIAASEDTTLPSLAPNSPETVVAEFAKWGFAPVDLTTDVRIPTNLSPLRRFLCWIPGLSRLAYTRHLYLTALFRRESLTPRAD